MLKPFKVCCDHVNRKDHNDFYCMAEDEDHANEQGKDAYPMSGWIDSCEVSKEEYPFTIHKEV